MAWTESLVNANVVLQTAEQVGGFLDVVDSLIVDQPDQPDESEFDEEEFSEEQYVPPYGSLQNCRARY